VTDLAVSTDPRTRYFILPTRLLWQSDAQSVHNADCLRRNDTGQATLYAPEVCLIRSGKGIAPPALLLDFGREWNGGIQIVLGAANRGLVNVRIRFGESASEAMGAPINDHANHDLVFPLRPWGAQEVGNTGFRFVRLDFSSSEDGDLEAQLIAVRAVALIRPLPYIGQFHCNDDRLNEIWKVGAHTVHLCLQDYVWDGVKRDRLAWIGDLHPEAQVVSTVFGQQAIVPQTLDYVRDQTPLPAWMNGISSYSLWWVLLQRDWFLHWGDHDYLRAQSAYLLPLLEQLAARVDAHGSEVLDGWRFLDWPTEGNDVAKHAGLHALLLRGLQAGAELCQALDEDAAGAACLRAAERMRRHVPPIVPQSKQASALLALAGLQSAEIVNREALAVDPLSGLSTFYGYYVLQARALAGDYSGALEVIRRYWGGMLDLGATSFWEHFDLSWRENAGRIDELPPAGKVDLHATYGEHCYQGLRHSLCHGWAAGPTAWLSEHVLGVQILAPGCRRLRIRPNLGDLTEVEGTFPTSCGPLRLRHQRTNTGEIATEIDAPATIKILRD